MGFEQDFNEIVLNKLGTGVRKKQHIAAPEDEAFHAKVLKGLLNFSVVKDRDPRVKIAQMGEDRFQVNLDRDFLALNFIDLLREGNEGIQFEYEQDLLDFEPDELLIKKSKMPLWVIHQAKDSVGTIHIKRVW